MRPDFIDDRFVLFVDMLGFANLTEEHTDSVGSLAPTFDADEDIIRWTDDTYPGDNSGVQSRPARRENPLESRFSAFHRCITGATRRLQQAGEGSVVAFSDSAFFEYPAAIPAMRGAMSLMRNCIAEGVPVRMGVGFGSFRILRFLSDSSHSVAVHGAQFIGTAVVRSYRAERCGAKGMRILLHPSAAEQLGSDAVCRQVLLHLPEPVNSVEYEINYASHADEVHGLNLDKQMFQSVSEMCDGTEAGFRFQYLETFHALNRMRQHRGRRPYPVAAALI